jgi:hypothetical protein
MDSYILYINIYVTHGWTVHVMHYARKALGVTSSKDAGGVVRGAPIDGLGDSAGNS